MLLKICAYHTVIVEFFRQQLNPQNRLLVCKISYCSEFSKRIEKIGECKAIYTFPCVHGRHLLD